MRRMGAFEAKNRLSELLALVEGGEEILITKHGKPVAKLVPSEDIQRLQVQRAIDAIKQLARTPGVGVEEILDWINTARQPNARD